MRDNNCKICGKDVGRGCNGHTKHKFKGGFAHDYCIDTFYAERILRASAKATFVKFPHRNLAISIGQIRRWRERE